MINSGVFFKQPGESGEKKPEPAQVSAETFAQLNRALKAVLEEGGAVKAEQAFREILRQLAAEYVALMNDGAYNADIISCNAHNNEIELIIKYNGSDFFGHLIFLCKKEQKQVFDFWISKIPPFGKMLALAINLCAETFVFEWLNKNNLLKQSDCDDVLRLAQVNFERKRLSQEGFDYLNTVYVKSQLKK